MNKTRLVMALCLFALVCCDKGSDKIYIVMSYDDFGPPSMAVDLIGMDWWQWERNGEAFPKIYDIKVVVYKGFDEVEISNKYPINIEEEKDYRYVEYKTVLEYLDRKIAYLKGTDIAYAAKDLEETKVKIIEEFK